MILKVFFTKQVKILAWTKKNLNGTLCFVIKLANCMLLLPVSVLYSCDLRKVTILLHTEHLGFLVLSKGLTNQFAIHANVTAAIREPEQSSQYGSTQQQKLRFSMMITLLWATLIVGKKGKQGKDFPYV